MTTTVTVKTHSWPVAVETSSHHDYSTPQRRGYGHSSSSEFVPAHSEKMFSVTDTTSVTFRELPEGATDLDYGCGEEIADACAEGAANHQTLRG